MKVTSASSAYFAHDTNFVWQTGLLLRDHLQSTNTSFALVWIYDQQSLSRFEGVLMQVLFAWVIPTWDIWK